MRVLSSRDRLPNSLCRFDQPKSHDIQTHQLDRLHSILFRRSYKLESLCFRMPLSDFKQLETGFYVVWTVRYKTPVHADRKKIARKDPQMARSDYYEPRWTSHYDHPVPRDRVRISWHKSEAAANSVRDLLNKEVVAYEWNLLLPNVQRNADLPQQWHILEVAKEVCVFDGDSFQSLSGKKWPLAEVESCIARFEKASEDEVLSMFGKHRRVPSPCWRTCLCWATCLCCFDSYMGCSTRA